MVQRWVLASMALSMDYRNWDGNTGWYRNTPECQWQGVGCDQNGRVNSIQLRGNSIAGQLVPEMYVLRDSLVTLDLGDNAIWGGLPTEYGRLANLQAFNLERNSIRGEIPSQLGNMQNLIELNLAYNYFNGDIPSSLADIPSLQRLYLFDNDLLGEMPNVICNSGLSDLEADCRELTCECCTQCWFQCGGRHPPCR
jgi:hypothetical protein